jgi:Htaa
MSSLSDLSPRSRGLLALLALAAATLASTAFAASASAAPASGEVVLTLKQGAQSSLLREGVKASPRSGKGSTQKVTLGVSELVTGAKTRILTGATLTLSANGKSAKLRDLGLQLGAKQTSVSARLGGKRKVFFLVKGAAKTGPFGVELSGPLSLTGKGAKALSAALGLDGITAGKLGSAAASAAIGQAAPIPPKGDEVPPPPPADLDPYFAQCKVSATSKVAGTVDPPAALPTLSDPKDVVGPAALNWGFKASFRGYIVGNPGSMHALDGASTVGAAPVYSGFDFPIGGGEYDANDAIDMTDDQAVVEADGAVVFCGTGHKFRVVISNPTVVIDGEDSRIVADVDTNMTGVWTEAQRVDLAVLDLEGITPFYNHSGSEVSWEDIPATLSETGAEAFCAGSSSCVYTPGTELDAIDVKVKTPYDLGAGDAAAYTALAQYVETELPFPLPDPTQGGCTLPVPAGTSSGTARTIDEVLFYDPANTTTWHGDATRADPVPDLSADLGVTGGSFKWGFRGSLRGSINATGLFNPALGATASHTPYYGNGGLTPPASPPRVPPGEMGNVAGRHFNWPAATTDSYYEANGAGNADDRLVLNTGGRVGFCQNGTGQWYGTVLTNPTVIIDGAKSRITIDVASRYRLSWVRGVVDFATLDLTDPGVTIGESSAAGTTTVTWTLPDAVSNVGPVKLTKDGERVVRMLSGVTYLEGLGLDGITVAASFPTPGP